MHFKLTRSCSTVTLIICYGLCSAPRNRTWQLQFGSYKFYSYTGASLLASQLTCSRCGMHCEAQLQSPACWCSVQGRVP